MYQLGDFSTTIIAILLALPAMLDWTTQRLAWRESRNVIRFWSALPAGFSLSWYLLSPISLLVKILVMIGLLSFLVIFGRIDRRPRLDGPKTPQHEEAQSIKLASLL